MRDETSKELGTCPSKRGASEVKVREIGGLACRTNFSQVIFSHHGLRLASALLLARMCDLSHLISKTLAELANYFVNLSPLARHGRCSKLALR